MIIRLQSTSITTIKTVIKTQIYDKTSENTINRLHYAKTNLAFDYDILIMTF